MRLSLVYAFLCVFCTLLILPKVKEVSMQIGGELQQVNFGGQLAELRRDRSLTQRQLAQIAHVSRSQVSRWESGNASPRFDQLAAVVHALGAEMQIQILTKRVR